MHWSAGFVGLPFLDHGRDRAGVDCWGLVRLCFAARGIDLPSYGERYVSTQERAEVAAVMSAEAAKRPWIRVPLGHEREWDVPMFVQGGVVAHVGIVTAPGRMLHVSRGAASRIEAYGAPRWRPRLMTFLRHDEA